MKRASILRSLPLPVIVAVLLTGLAGCYTDTVDSLSTFTFQLPVNMEFRWRDKIAPDTTTDRVNLLENAAYRDNREKIRSAEVFQIGYWIDTLVGDPGLEDAEFQIVEFYLRFPGDEEEYLLGRYPNVTVREYYKRPHLLEVPEATARAISEAVREKPEFEVIQRYGEPTRGDGLFPIIDGRVDLVIRVDVEL